MLFLSVDLRGVAGSSHFPPLDNKEKWGEMGIFSAFCGKLEPCCPANPTISVSPPPLYPLDCKHTGGGGRELYKLEFLHFKLCTKILHAICSVFLRICAGNNSKHSLFLMSNYWEPYIFVRSVLRSGTDFVAPEFVDSSFPPPPIE